MSSTDLATGIVSLRDRRVLVTQASEFMGPMLCSVLAEAGADVVADCFVGQVFPVCGGWVTWWEP